MRLAPALLLLTSAASRAQEPTDLAQDVACLDQVEPPDLWAQHLVDLAILAQADQQD